MPTPQKNIPTIWKYGLDYSKILEYNPYIPITDRTSLGCAYLIYYITRTKGGQEVNEKKDTVSLTEVAATLGVNKRYIKEMIRTQQLPIGIVFRAPESTQDRIIIPRKRWEAWCRGQDL